MAYDEKHRTTIRDKLMLYVHPLKPDEHPQGLVNIVTGRMNPETVSVENVRTILFQQRQQFESRWPEGFYRPIVNKVKVMVGSQRRQLKK